MSPEPGTCILGSWSSYSRRRKNLDALIHDAVSGVLRHAGTDLNAVDCVVTVSSDTVDGAIAPLLRSAAAGAVGRDYLHVTGASASAIHAALTLIKSRLADTVLVVGWGEWTKPVVDAIPDLETDPVFHRSLGIGSLQLAAMQTAWLINRGLVTGDAAIAYADAMRTRKPGWGELQTARTRRLAAPHEATSPGLCRELMPDGVDRASALLLSSTRRRDSLPGLWIDALATCFRPLWPQQEDLDPSVWASEVIERCRSGHDDLARMAIEVSSTNAVIGLRALAALGAAGDWSSNSLLNRFGGGLAAYNGAADGLARIDLLARLPACEAGGQVPSDCMVLELAGPIGQATAAIHLVWEP